MSLDLGNFHSNLVSQPFVFSQNQYSVLPNLFANIEPNRMLSGALNKSATKKKIYAKLIDEIEKKNIHALKTFLEKKTRYIILRQSFKSIDNRIINPDFVLVDKLTNAILIVDYKHFLNPSNASEIAYRISEAKKGLQQINAYEIFLTSNLALLFRFGINEGVRTFKILLTRTPTAIALDEEQVKITDLETFKFAIAESNSFLEMANLLQNDSRVEIKADNFELVDLVTKAGDWKFVRTIHTGRN